jgi:hypothetical protein
MGQVQVGILGNLVLIVRWTDASVCVLEETISDVGQA